MICLAALWIEILLDTIIRRILKEQELLNRYPHVPLFDCNH